MDPDISAALTSLSSPPEGTHAPTLEQLQDLFSKLVVAPFRDWHGARLPPDSQYSVQDYQVVVDQGEILVRCLIPAPGDDSRKFPLLVHMHGGGFTFGDINMDDYYLRRICVDLQIVVVNVEYRKLPGYTFPTPNNDALAALKWVVEHERLLRIDVKKGLILAGDSAGASIATALAHDVRDDPFFADRQPTGQFLREPFLLHPDVLPESLRADYRSWDEVRPDERLPFTPTRAGIDGLLLGYKAPAHDPRFSPLLYPSHAGLPPTYFQAMGYDPVRDDAVVYAKVLQEAGVKTKLDIYPGGVHGFFGMFPTIPLAEKLTEDTHIGIKWLLEQNE